MIYALIFEDDEKHVSKRPQYMADHLQFLMDNQDRIKAAGTIKEVGTDTPAGGMWLVEANSPGQVQELIEADPFWTIGLRKTIRLLEWSQVFANGKRLI
jgi:uncharacterized protein YciI